MALFVSYCSVDHKQIKVLFGQLAKLKREVYTETKSVTGEVAWSVICETIQACEAFLLALTPNTLLSEARRLEYQYASALNKPIIVVALEAIPDNVSDDGKLAYIDVSQTVDFRELDENSAYALSEALAHLPAAPPDPDPLPPLPDWTQPLHDLKQTVEQPRIPFKEQPRLVLNLREYAERKETNKTAVALLKVLNKHTSRSVESAQELADILDDVERTESTKGKGQNSPRLAVALIALIALIVLVIIIVRGFPDLNTHTTTALTSTASPTTNGPTKTVNSLLTQTPSFTATTNAATTLTTQSSPPTVASPLAVIATEAEATLRAAATLTAPSMNVYTPTPATPIPTVTATSTAGSVSMLVQVTDTPVPTETPTVTPAASFTQTAPPTSTPSPTVTFTLTPLPTNTATQTASFTPSVTMTVSYTPSLPPSALPTNTQIVALSQPTTTLTSTATLLTQVTEYIGMRVEDSADGVRVVEVGSAARLAGVKVGDYIVTVNLEPITTSADFMRIMNDARPFSTVGLHVRSSDGLATIQLSLSGADFIIVMPTPSPSPTSTSQATS